MKFTSNVLVFASLTAPALGATYSLSQSVVGDQFLTAFTFETIADPTLGRVNYVDQATAQSDGLVSTTYTSFRMGADHTTVLSPSGPGRNSVRIRSVDTYSTHVAVFDVKHMPEGCGTWPAIWESDESTWPNGGEVDIVEGVNDQGPNQSTLHTSPGCSIPSNTTSSGTVLATDCNTDVGCGIRNSDLKGYGPAFNANGGGYYAMERTNSAVSVWFWERSAPVPHDVFAHGPTVDTSHWGQPTAIFPNADCDIASHFDANNIIINLTFCGQWAGVASVYAASGCPSTCVDYVNNNPSAFKNAYFEFASLSIYK